MPKCAGVGAQLVGDQQFGREALLLEQLAHQPQRRPTIAPALNQHVEDLALVVDGTPQIHSLARDPYYHLVEVPAAQAGGVMAGLQGADAVASFNASAIGLALSG